MGWDSPVERAGGLSETPLTGSKYPCWCCSWLRLVDEKHRAGKTIYCVTSNIYRLSWVDDFGAASSELSDAVADVRGLPRERFRNGRPHAWGEGDIRIISGSAKHSFHRGAQIHPDTQQPLGQGCRWERQALDS